MNHYKYFVYLYYYILLNSNTWDWGDTLHTQTYACNTHNIVMVFGVHSTSRQLIQRWKSEVKFDDFKVKKVKSILKNITLYYAMKGLFPLLTGSFPITMQTYSYMLFTFEFSHSSVTGRTEQHTCQRRASPPSLESGPWARSSAITLPRGILSNIICL